ncbi:hypothetical protein GL279_17780 [Paracoccus limosus]|uniref:Uncharacterized protein n=1 Tax=Paracoccus limosus TaxID=913252 RepID=A0A844H6Q0_9RHOB|nr:hypothetical protein [Paracoccus limosus]MTH36442.1 hypothetical protein [Paracoccus limosus]
MSPYFAGTGQSSMMNKVGEFLLRHIKEHCRSFEPHEHRLNIASSRHFPALTALAPTI